MSLGAKRHGALHVGQRFGEELLARGNIAALERLARHEQPAVAAPTSASA